jgi:archaellum component FlaC
VDALKFSPEEEQALERSIEALRQFPRLRRAMIEALQMEELFAVPERLDRLTEVVQQILARLDAVEKVAHEAKRAAEEAKQEAQEAKQAAQEAKQEAQEAKQAAQEAKQEAQEAKQAAQEAKQIALEVRDRVDKVEQRLKSVEHDVAHLKGDSEELKARRRIPSVLGRYFKKLRIYDSEQLYPLIGETLILDDEDAAELLYADLFVHAQTKISQQEYWLVVEVSWGVGVSDVDRAHERAAILQKHGYPAIGVAMGRAVTREAERRAKELGVIIARDGTLTGARPPQ